MPTDEDVLAPSRDWDEVFGDVIGRSARLRRRRRVIRGTSGAAALLLVFALAPLLTRDTTHNVNTISPASNTTLAPEHDNALAPAAAPSTQPKRLVPVLPLPTTTTQGRPVTGPARGRPGTTRLAVACFDAASSPVPNLCVTDPDGPGDVRVLVRGALNPAWSPDGTRLAYTSEQMPRLHIIAADGTDDHVIGTGFDPAWSPDGLRLAFVDPTGPASGAQDGVYVMNADGTGRRLVAAPNGDAGSPSWVNRGMLVYSVEAASGAARTIGTPGEIHTITLDGRDDKVLTRGSDPAVSPDGRLLAYIGKGGIVVANIDGSGAHAITGPDEMDSLPSWSPDGLRIAFDRAAAVNDMPDLLVVSVKGGPTRTVIADAFDASWGVVPR
jgi:dipeptidyl aminopeptidase/acylaminoacyl peptidase